MEKNVIEQKTWLIAEGLPFKFDNITIRTTDGGKLLVTWWTPTVFFENISQENIESELVQLKKNFIALAEEYRAIELLRNELEVEYHISYDSGKAGVGICSEINNEVIWYIEK